MPSLIRPKNADPAKYLQWLFRKTETDIIDEIFRKRRKGYVDYAEVAALERIQSDLQDMVDQSYEYVPKMIEKQFYGTPKDLSGYANARSIAGRTNMVMMETLTDNLLGEIIEAAAVAQVNAGRLYTIARLDEDEFRNAALSNTAYAEALGKGAYTSAEMMEASIRNHGITSFVDKAGRKWSLSDYCNMAARTTARQAEVAGVLSRDDHDLYQIVKIGSTCPVCAVYEGRVYSKSGTNPNYPPLAMAFGKIDPAGGDDLSNTYLNIHPNCLHSLIKFTEMGKSETQLQRIREFSSPETNPLNHDPRSQKQIKAYREKERNRAKKLRELRKEQEKRSNFIAEQTKITEKGLPSTNQYAVNAGFVNSQKYHAEYENKGMRKPAMEQAVEYGRQLMEKANGTANEFMVAFDARTGNKIVDNLGRRPGRLQTGFTNSEAQLIIEHEGKIILLHNHPGSKKPSGRDICTMAEHAQVEMSLVTCHNGTVYAITRADPRVVKIYQQYYDDALLKGVDAETAKVMATSDLYQLNDRMNGKLFEVIGGEL